MNVGLPAMMGPPHAWDVAVLLLTAGAALALVRRVVRRG